METFILKQDLGNLDIFKELYDFAESQKFQNTNALTLLKFHEATQHLEEESRSFIENSNIEIAKIAHSYLEMSLHVFLYVLKRGGLLERPMLNAYFRYINFLRLVFNKENCPKNPLFFSRNFTKNFPSLFGPKVRYNSTYLKRHFDHGIPIDLMGRNPFYYDVDFKELEISIEYDFNLIDKTLVKYDKESEIINLYMMDFMVHGYMFQNTDELIYQSECYEYILDLSIDSKQHDAQKISSSLFKIISSISSIENVSLEFEHLEKGSLLTRIRLKMKDFIAKSEVKNFFILLRELLFGALTGGKISATDTLRKTAEIDKLEREQKLIQRQLDDNEDANNKKKDRLLDLERKRLENRSLELKNTAAQLENLKTIVQLAKDGILEADLTKIDLNGINFINSHGNEIIDSEEDINEMT
ncbi:hypothetical protein D2V93_06920 [Flagellimonas taeanensis]|nr:hypothetical protein D2V93_06920 [Allomuricauda taeanensis]